MAHLVRRIFYMITIACLARNMPGRWDEGNNENEEGISSRLEYGISHNQHLNSTEQNQTVPCHQLFSYPTPDILCIGKGLFRADTLLFFEIFHWTRKGFYCSMLQKVDILGCAHHVPAIWIILEPSFSVIVTDWICEMRTLEQKVLCSVVVTPGCSFRSRNCPVSQKVESLAPQTVSPLAEVSA